MQQDLTIYKQEGCGQGMTMALHQYSIWPQQFSVNKTQTNLSNLINTAECKFSLPSRVSDEVTKS